MLALKAPIFADMRGEAVMKRIVAVRGKKVDVTEQWTDVWMKTQDMGWQVVASQSSPLKN